MDFRFYSNALRQASVKLASGIFVTGLLLIGFGVVIVALPMIFALLAATVFFVAGLSCAAFAVKIYLAQRKMGKRGEGEQQVYRDNVRIHIKEDHEDTFDF